MYSKGLELSSRSEGRASQGHDDPRFMECLSMLNQIQEVEKALQALPASPSTPEEVRRSIRIYLSVQPKCSCWRALYLSLFSGYLLLRDLPSAELLLSRVSPDLLRGLADRAVFPFSIAAWDAARLDLFGNDVSAVDVALVARWLQLFLLQGRLGRAVALLAACRREPRFRDAQRRAAALRPFWGLARLQVGQGRAAEP